jgi:hypothetical protein
MIMMKIASSLRAAIGGLPNAHHIAFDRSHAHAFRPAAAEHQQRQAIRDQQAAL